jgi:hypothetical protein
MVTLTSCAGSPDSFRTMCRGDQNRPTFAQKLQDVAHCNRERAVIDGGRALPRPDATQGLSIPARALDGRFPERRLPDPRDALEHESGRRSAPRVVDEGLEGAELVLPTSDLDGDPPRSNDGRNDGKASVDMPGPRAAALQHALRRRGTRTRGCPNGRQPADTKRTHQKRHTRRLTTHHRRLDRSDLQEKLCRE